MKTYALLIISLTSMLMTACVSKKKYQEAVDRGRHLDDELVTANRENTQLRDSIEVTSLEAARDLQIKEAELNEKSQEIEKRRLALKEMEDLVNEQREAVRSLHQEVCSALKCFTPEELKVEVRDGKLYVSLSDKLLFPSGSDAVNDRGKEALALLANVMSLSDLEIMVEGHTDSIPIHTRRNRDNWDLSVHRATSVSRLLIKYGIPPERIIACGRGSNKPIADNRTELGRQSNRRTEVVLAPRLDRLWKLTEEADPATVMRQ